MAFHDHPRFILSLLAAVLTASTIGCGGSDGRGGKRLGDDVIGSGYPSYPMDSVTGDVILYGRDLMSRGSVGGD